MTPSVYITRPIPAAGLHSLSQAGFACTSHPGNDGPNHDELVVQACRHDAIVSQLADPIDELVLKAASGRCRIIATCAVGVDNIDLAAAKRFGIVVTHTPDVLTEATADLT